MRLQVAVLALRMLATLLPIDAALASTETQPSASTASGPSISCPRQQSTERARKPTFPKQMLKVEEKVPASAIAYCIQSPAVAPHLFQEQSTRTADPKASEPETKQSARETFSSSPTEQTPFEVRIGLKDIHLDLKSPSPYIFLLTLVLSGALIFGLLWFIGMKVTESGRSSLPIVLAAAGILALAAVTFFFYRQQPSVGECKQQVEETIGNPAFEKTVAQFIETQMRDDVASCRQALSSAEVDLRVLRATTARGLPGTMAFSLTALGLMVGLFLGQLMSRIELRRKVEMSINHEDGDDDRERLLRKIRQMLRDRESEVLRDLLERHGRTQP